MGRDATKMKSRWFQMFGVLVASLVLLWLSATSTYAPYHDILSSQQNVRRYSLPGGTLYKVTEKRSKESFYFRPYLESSIFFVSRMPNFGPFLWFDDSLLYAPNVEPMGDWKASPLYDRKAKVFSFTTATNVRISIPDSSDLN